MKKVFYSFAILVATLQVMTSCGTNPPENPQPIADITMYVNEQKELPAEYAPWRSVNAFVAEVVDGTTLVAHHVGDVTLHSKDSSCLVTVEPHYTFAPYDDPLLQFGLTRSELRSQLGKADDTDGGDYIYYSKDDQVTYSYYFDDGTKTLYRVTVTMESSNTNISAERIMAMLEERYELISADESDNLNDYIYVDCYKEDYEKNKNSAKVRVEFIHNPKWMMQVQYMLIRH